MQGSRFISSFHRPLSVYPRTLWHHCDISPVLVLLQQEHCITLDYGSLSHVSSSESTVRLFGTSSDGKMYQDKALLCAVWTGSPRSTCTCPLPLSSLDWTTSASARIVPYGEFISLPRMERPRKTSGGVYQRTGMKVSYLFLGTHLYLMSHRTPFVMLST